MDRPEFSIKEEIRVTVKESLDIDLTKEQLDGVYEGVVNDERVLNAITIGIYRAIIDELGQDDERVDDIENELYRIECSFGGGV